MELIKRLHHLGNLHLLQKVSETLQSAQLFTGGRIHPSGRVVLMLIKKNNTYIHSFLPPVASDQAGSFGFICAGTEISLQTSTHHSGKTHCCFLSALLYLSGFRKLSDKHLRTWRNKTTKCLQRQMFLHEKQHYSLFFKFGEFNSNFKDLSAGLIRRDI